MAATKVSEKPILFSAEMVKAILADEKTQTRRVMKPQPPTGEFGDSVYSKLCGPEWYEPIVVGRDGEERPGKPIFGVYSNDGEWGCKCPWEPGMRLWVRESWAPCIGGPCDENNPVLYRADDAPIYKQITWRPSIHMPYWASRITLELIGVQVERLQSINDEDCYAEGCVSRNPEEPQLDFEELWDRINGKTHPWASNPWIWVLGFMRVREFPARSAAGE